MGHKQGGMLLGAYKGFDFQILLKIYFKLNIFQIDLRQLVKITAIATQGYEGMMYDEYIPKYDLKYKTSPYSTHWYPYVSSCRAYSGAQVIWTTFDSLV